jgi:hydroxyacylglutathione hydrolase
MSLYNLAKRRTFEYSPVVLKENDVIITEDNDDVLRKIGVDGKIICTPGHTDDSISVILDNGDAFVSDACLSNLGFLHYRPIEVSNLKQVFASWQKIIDNGTKTIYPSHVKPFPVENLIPFKEKYTPSI